MLALGYVLFIGVSVVGIDAITHKGFTDIFNKKS